MIGIEGSAGRPFSPWHAAQIWALSSIESAEAAVAPAMRTATTATLRNIDETLRAQSTRSFARRRAEVKRKRPPPSDSDRREAAGEARGLLDRKGDDGVAALGVDLGVAARTDDDILLAADHIGGGRSVDAGAGLELPQHLAVGGVIGLEPPVGLAGEQETAGRREYAADHRLRRLDLPGDLAGVVVDRADIAEAR